MSSNCTILKCSNAFYALGLCHKHYRRFKRHGSPHSSQTLDRRFVLTNRGRKAIGLPPRYLLVSPTAGID